MTEQPEQRPAADLARQYREAVQAGLHKLLSRFPIDPATEIVLNELASLLAAHQKAVEENAQLCAIVRGACESEDEE